MKRTKNIEMEVMEVHNLFWESYARRDIELRFSLCSEDITFIGSGLHERALNKTEYKNINNEGVKQFPDPFQIEFLWTNLTVLNENVACVESEVVWSQLINNEESKELLRNTTLLKYDNNKWLVTHVHGSVPDYRLKDGDYMTNEQTIIRNRELERQVFERTRDLNKTLEELEEKNRELRIEGSLERVRAQAMSMTKPEDLLSVCEKLFTELKILGFNKLRNAIIHILNDENGFFLDYDYSDFTGGTITNTFYNSHPILINFLKQIKSSNDAFAEVVIDGSQLNDWKEFRRKSGQPEDSRLDNIPALYYYFYSIGIGDIGISTFNPIDENQLEILKRFRNVFSLSYQRYLDIALAEAQAREAQIEAALERVRTKAMAMQKSDDLSVAVTTIFDELDKLNLGMLRCGIGILNKEKRSADVWTTTISEQGKTVQVSGDESMDIHPLLKGAFDAWLQQKDFSYLLQGEDLIRYYRALIESNFKLPNFQSKVSESENLQQHYYVATFQGGGLFAFRETVFPDEAKLVMKRFADVFNFTYTRFSDLKQAEAQTREAQIELALERVRSKAMAMHSPNDLSETVNVFFKELKTLGIIPIRCGVGQIDEATRTTSLTTTTSSQQGDSFRVIGKVKQTGHPVLDGIFDHWKLQQEYHPILKGEDIKAYYSVMNAQIGYPKYPEGVTQYGNCFFFKEGFVFAWTENLLSEEELIIFRRFTTVLSLTYRRYLDLKEAVERNNIIQAENDRKTKELEDARQLQLSMLPKELPNLPHLDIAVYMKTATEVGGDYYDFHVQLDGTLTALVGDATGHGMMSGMMVSIMKSFFISNRTNIELKQFFENSNNSIKDMHLGHLMMPLMGVQITSEKVIATNAGMPSLIYFRNKSQKAGEFVSNNLPLGAMKGTKYSSKEIKYEKGDTLLLMSDGFAELKNEKNEYYTYPRIIREFISVVHKSSNEIVDHLKNSASEWENGVEPDDDVTFVIIKIR